MSSITPSTSWSDRVTKTCAECGGTFSAHPIVIPHCADCERRHPTTCEQRRMLKSGSPWSESVGAQLARREYDTTGRITAPQVILNAKPTPMAAVLGWCDQPSRPLTITGPVGRGKTWEAVGAMRHMTMRREQGRSRLINCVSLHRTLEASEVRDIGDLLVLVLDDFGARLSPGAVATAYELIELRTAAGKPLIVTTNLSRADIAAMDERIESRLSSGQWLRMDGKDRRLA